MPKDQGRLPRSSSTKALSVSQSYRPTDRLFLWFLGDPAKPRYVGEINWVRSLAGVSLAYSPAWLDHGFPLSEDLPLMAQEFFPTEKNAAVGSVDDARPDRWGERLIRFIDKPPRLSLLEYLFFAGDERFGALGVSTSPERYLPRTTGPLPTLKEVARVYELVQDVLENVPIPEPERRLVSPGVTMGGARPKALLELDGQQWIVKFLSGEPIDLPLIEHASMTLAARAGIRAATTRAIPLQDGHALAVLRFDRRKGKRVHALSAKVALKGAEEQFGYPELAQLLRRRGVVENDVSVVQSRELFRRMIFNILFDNTDDHEKNHVLLVNDAFQYELSPAFDVLPSGQALGFQQMRVGEQMGDSTLENAMSLHQAFSLNANEAISEIRRVARTVQGWKNHFKKMGVRDSDVEALAEHVDRPFLKDQREEFGGRATSG
ncbi:MAG: type II toxin-antitoxin system HipA family toxin [Myxococcaceae bacterium]